MLPKGIEDRDADVWEPLLAIAELAGGHWPERARVAAVAAVAADGVKTTPSPGIELLADIKAVFDRLPGEAIHTTDLLAALGNLDQRWRRLDGKRLARTLHGYGMNQTNKDQRIGAQGHQGLPAGVLRGRLVALPAICGYSGYRGYIGYRRGGRR